MKKFSRVSLVWLEQRFPELKNIQPLSQGGQKQVFSGFHQEDGDIVLKLMHPGSDLERTRRELIAVSKIKSSRVPNIFECGSVATPIGDCIWFREQRVHGPTVREQLVKGPFSFPNLLRMALQITETLVDAEAVNIVHRDVKPENIIIDNQENFWLIDFGLARHLGLESLTATANFFGNVTWGYAPLEQCRNFKSQIDSRADLFALGVTLYECGTGINPFRDGAGSELEVLKRVEKGYLPPLKWSQPLAPEFIDFVKTLTQRQRVHRPDNVQTALEWIKEICIKEGIY